jgi:hypothetical protein
MQQVQGVSATESGLRLVPLMAGLLLTSLASGQIISRTGRYKLFPILGAAASRWVCFCSRGWINTRVSRVVEHLHVHLWASVLGW